MIDTDLITTNKNILIVLLIVLFLVEVQILAVFAAKAGHKSMLQVMDNNGNLIYETNGKKLSDFNKYYFEKTFGPLKEYNVKLVTTDHPFHFRAWFVCAMGIPVGIILLFSLLFKICLALFNDKSKHDFNIFMVGTIVFLAVMAYWIVPDTIIMLAVTGTAALVKFKWIFIVAAAAFFILLVWVIYLKYLLAQKTIETQSELAKYRLQFENGEQNLQEIVSEARPLVKWDKWKGSQHANCHNPP